MFILKYQKDAAKVLQSMYTSKSKMGEKGVTNRQLTQEREVL